MSFGFETVRIRSGQFIFFKKIDEVGFEFERIREISQIELDVVIPANLLT
jgi:hypothetical protein